MSRYANIEYRLSELKLLKLRKAALEEKIFFQRCALERVTRAYSTEPSSGAQSMENRIADILDAEAELNDLKRELADKSGKALEAIERIDDMGSRRLLRLMYSGCIRKNRIKGNAVAKNKPLKSVRRSVP